MTQRSSRDRALSACHGYRVAATDGLVGEVDTPLFPPDVAEPDYLVLRVGRRPRVRYPAVAAALVEEVDPELRLILVRGTRREIASLPEHLPLTL